MTVTMSGCLRDNFGDKPRLTGPPSDTAVAQWPNFMEDSVDRAELLLVVHAAQDEVARQDARGPDLVHRRRHALHRRKEEELTYEVEMQLGDAIPNVEAMVEAALDDPIRDDVLRLAAGENPRIVRIPRPIIFALGRISEVALGLVKRSSPLSAYRLQSALAKRSFTSANAALLGWEPRVGVCAGIEREVQSHARPDCS